MAAVLALPAAASAPAPLAAERAATRFAPGAPAPTPVSRCTVDDPRLMELSGLVVVGGEAWAMADGGRQVQVHRIDLATCTITDTRGSDVDPFDPEDIARGPDGAMWVGDVGDNESAREAVAVIVLPARGEPRLHRLAYPDGPHDAEALLVDAGGRPVVITKEIGRPAGIYRTERPPDGTGPTPLLRVGEVMFPESSTPGSLGTRLVTGAAASADGRVVALRSYADAWLYPVPDGDLVAALTGTPVQVPLPGEPQGEAIAFEADGTLLSGSEARRGVPGEIRAVAGAAGLVSDRGPVPTGDPEAPAAPEPAREWLPAVIGGSAAVALLVLVATAVAVRGRARR